MGVVGSVILGKILKIFLGLVEKEMIEYDFCYEW